MYQRKVRKKVREDCGRACEEEQVVLEVFQKEKVWKAFFAYHHLKILQCQAGNNSQESVIILVDKDSQTTLAS